MLDINYKIVTIEKEVMIELDKVSQPPGWDEDQLVSSASVRGSPPTS